MQASRVLQLERNSLEYLLHHFCEVSANKEYVSHVLTLSCFTCFDLIKFLSGDFLSHVPDFMHHHLDDAHNFDFYRYQNADWRLRPLPVEMLK